MTVTTAQPEYRAQENTQRFGVIARISVAVLGAALVFAAFGVWLTPGASAAPELSLMKLGVSVFMLVAGMGCLIAARPNVRERAGYANPD